VSPRGSRRAEPAGGLQVTGGDGVYVVHGPGPLSGHLAATAREILGAPAAGRATVLVGAGFADPDALCDRLAPALDACQASGVTQVRLVMTGGAAELPGRPAPARRLTERWTFEVVAPAGAAMVVPGGGLFAPDVPGTPGAWWHFSRGLLPRRLGARHPEPAWQQALDRVAADTAEGCVVHHIPAGLLVLPGGVPAEGAGAVRYALPADPEHPAVLVGAAGCPPVPADALADIVAALPAPVRGTVRLLPGDGRDLLPTAQQAADLLGTELRVASGLPVLLDDAAPPRTAGSPWEHPARNPASRTMVLDEQGSPSWRPYVETVTCVPAESRPRLAEWRAPIGGLRPGEEPGTLLLDRHWQVAVTRAGLWVGPRGARVPDAAAARPLEPDVMAVDLGHPDRSLDDATLWAPLQRLFAALQDDVRDRTMIQLHGEASPATHRAVRRLAVQYGLAVAARGWRPFLPGAVPGPPAAAAPPSTASAGAGAAAPDGRGLLRTAGPGKSADGTTGGGLAAERAPLRAVPTSGPSAGTGPAAAPAAPAAAGQAVAGGERTAEPGVPGSPVEVEAVPTAPPATRSERGVPAPHGPDGPPPGEAPGNAPTVGGPAPAVPAYPAPGGPGAEPGTAYSTHGQAGAPVTPAPGPDGTQAPSRAPGTVTPPDGGGARAASTAAGGHVATADGQAGPAPRPTAGGAPQEQSGREQTSAGGAPQAQSDREQTSAGGGRAPGTFDGNTTSGQPTGSNQLPPAAEPSAPDSGAVARPPSSGPAGRTAGTTGTAGRAASGAAPAVERGAQPAAGGLEFPATPWSAPGGQWEALPPGEDDAAGPLTVDPPAPVPTQATTGPGTTKSAPPSPGAVDGGHRPGPAAPETPDGVTAGTSAPSVAGVSGPAASGRSGALVGPDGVGRGAGVTPSVAPDVAAAADPSVAGVAATGSGAQHAGAAGPGLPGTGPGTAAAAAGRLRGLPGGAPVLPSRRSTQAERDAARALLGSAWDGHSAAVARAMIRVPALRGGSAAESEDAAAELAVLHAYLTADPGDPWSYEALRADAATGGPTVVPVLACLAAALRRLPSYRGAVVRPAGGPGLAETARLLSPGEELGDILPVSGLAVERGGPAPGERYLVWSMTGRRASSLLGRAGAEAADPGDEVLFAPGTRLRLLAVDESAGAAVVLLRELPESAPAAVPGVLDAADEAVLDRLRSRGLTGGPPAAPFGHRQLPGRLGGVLGLLARHEPPGSG
jgi:hypothetical protein